MQFRAATVADEAFIFGLVPAFVDFPLPPWRTRASLIAGIEQDLRERLDSEDGQSIFWIAESDQGEPLGFLHLIFMRDFFTRGRNAHVSDLAVSPAARGQGVGSALLAEAERLARDAGCERMSLAVFEGNTRARALYEREGYGVEIHRMFKALEPRPPRR